MLAIRELYSSLSATALVSAISIFWLYFSRFSVRGSLWWGCGFLSFFMCLSLITFRGNIPHFVSVVVSNVGGIAGYVFLWFGIRCYFNRPLKVWTWLVGGLALGSIALSTYWFTYQDLMITRRIAGFSIIGLTLNAITAYELLADPNRPQTATYLAINNILNGIILSLRATTSFYLPPIASYFNSGWPTVSFLLWSNISLTFTTFGLIMMMVEELNIKLAQQAKEDPLTGLFNRRALHSITSEDFFALQKQHGNLGLLMLDIDHFKKVNDTYGHSTGDDLLQHFATQVSQCLRSNDLLYRIGGEEFLVVVPASSHDKLLALGERIRTHIEQTPLVTAKDTIPHTVSIGCSTTYAEDTCLENGMERADTALYSAKKNGRNKVEALLPQLA